MKQYQPHQIRLANEFADTLNDHGSLHLHLSFVEKYTEKSLREILARVMARPDEKITTSRAAYFNFLVHKDGIELKANNNAETTYGTDNSRG